VAIFVTLNENDAISLIDSKIDPSELFRGRVAEMDRGLSVQGIASGGEELIQPLLFFLSPHVCSLRVVSFEVPLHVIAMHEAGIAAFGRADVRAVAVVDHLVML
jgi:hypothetical protein